MPSGTTSIYYTVETRQLFIGQENGTVSEYTLASDFNRMMLVREYLAHQARVTEIIFAINCEWVLSVGRDKVFSYNCTQTGRNIGTYNAEAWCTALQYPFLKIFCIKYIVITKTEFNFTLTYCFDRQIKDMQMSLIT